MTGPHKKEEVRAQKHTYVMEDEVRRHRGKVHHLQVKRRGRKQTLLPYGAQRELSLRTP